MQVYVYMYMYILMSIYLYPARVLALLPFCTPGDSSYARTAPPAAELARSDSPGP